MRDIDWLAREAATLDQLTEGKFVLAVTAGFWADELAYRGIDPGRRGAEFRLRLGELLAKLAGNTLSPVPYTSKGPPVWLAGERATMRHAARLSLPFQASRATPAELAPTARLWKELGGGLLAHRIYAEAGTSAPDGVQVARHVVAGSAAQLADAFAAYRELGVGDLSVVLGHDDASAMRTLEVLLSDVLPTLTKPPHDRAITP